MIYRIYEYLTQTIFYVLLQIETRIRFEFTEIIAKMKF